MSKQTGDGSTRMGGYMSMRLDEELESEVGEDQAVEMADAIYEAVRLAVGPRPSGRDRSIAAALALADALDRVLEAFE